MERLEVEFGFYRIHMFWALFGLFQALAAEVTATFSRRLSPLNMIVRELTGDMQLSRNELEETQVVLGLL